MALAWALGGGRWLGKDGWDGWDGWDDSWNDLLLVSVFFITLIMLFIVRGAIGDWLDKHPLTREQKLRAASDALQSAIRHWEFYRGWPEADKYAAAERAQARLELDKRIREYDKLEKGATR